MARFHDLPNEILLNVWKYVLPEDLENFAQISRHVFQLSEFLIQDHRNLIRVFRTFDSHQHTGTKDGFTVGPVPMLFRDVLSDPRIGHYVRHLKFDTLLTKTSNTSPYISPNEAVERRKQQHDLVDFAVFQSKMPRLQSYYNHAKIAGFSSRHGATIGEETLVALLLPLLPNLNSLSIKMPSRIQYLDRVLQNGACCGVPWLGNLTTLCLEGSHQGAPTELPTLTLFNFLPSLKSITAFKVKEGGYTSSSYPPPQDSHATELKLLNARVATRALYWYLESFANLQNLTLEYSPYCSKYPDRYESCWIRSALVARAQATLQTLTFLGPIRRDGFMGSLRPFKSLQVLEIEWRFIFPQDDDLWNWPSQVLPASLHTLRLHDVSQSSGTQYLYLIGGLQDAKLTTCLQLKTVHFEVEEGRVGTEKTLEELYQICQEVGITLTFVKGD